MQVSSYLFQSPYPQSVQVGRPDPVEEQKQASQEEVAKEKAAQAEKQSMQAKDDQSGVSVKSSTMYQNDISSNDTTKAVNAFMDVAKDVNRLEYLNAYTN
jgi:hypothetical protein